MGFKWRLEHEIVEEWREAYIDYAKLKELIYDAAREQDSSIGIASTCAGDQRSAIDVAKTRKRSRRDSSSSSKTARSQDDEDSVSESGEPAKTYKQEIIFQALDEQLNDVERYYRDTLMKEARSRYAILKGQLHELELHREEYQHAYKHINVAFLPLFVALRHIKERLFPEGEEGSEQKKIFGSSYKYEPHRLGAANRQLELALCEFYIYLGSINNYCAINKEGFEKCARKIEQELGVKCYKDYKEKLHKTKFAHHYALNDIQSNTEGLYTNYFGGRNRKRAVHRLRGLIRPATARSFATARAGTFLGIAIVLGLFGMLNANHPATQHRIPQYTSLLQIYAAFFLPVFLGFTIGFNLIAWQRARIDRPVVFSFDRRTHLHLHEYFELPTFLLMTLALCLYLSFSIFHPNFPPQLWPMVWLWSTLAFFLNPFPIFHYPARWWLVRSLCRVVMSGLIEVEFRDFFLGDQLCSIYYSIYNMYLLGCAYSHHFSKDVDSICSTNDTWVTPALASLPPLFRLGHSVRRYANNPETKTHLLNVLKYAINILYQFCYYNWRINGSPSGAKFSLFVVAAALNGLASYSWDVRIDWDLLNRGCKHTMLRDRLAYSKNHWFYYFAIVANLPLRFAWLIYLTGQSHNALKGFVNSLLEVMRRCLWNFLRVESEHIGNVDDFRAVREVPLPYEVAAIDRSAKRSDPPEPAFAEQEENSSEEGEEVNERSPLNGTSKKNGNGYGT